MFIYCGLLTDLITSQTLEVVTDNELLDLCRSENQVVALFSMYFITIFLFKFRVIPKLLIFEIFIL